MCKDVLSALQFDVSTAKRATWEAFEFSVPAAGVVVVTNASYGTDADGHTHSVNIENGIPIGCTCPADEYQSGACKHRVAIAIREPVLAAASASGPDGSEKRALADGGAVVDPKTQEESAETTHARECDNPECDGYDADGRPLLSWECWEVWASQ